MCEKACKLTVSHHVGDVIIFAGTDTGHEWVMSKDSFLFPKRNLYQNNPSMQGPFFALGARQELAKGCYRL